MLHSKYYILLISVFTIISTYFFSWWLIPIGICIIAYFSRDLSTVKASALATGATSGIWMAWAGIQEFSAINKVSVLTGQIIANQPPFTIYVLTGLTISIISGMAALLGNKLQQL